MTTAKGKRHSQWIKQIYRQIGHVLALGLRHTPISANFVTVSRLFFMGLAGWLIFVDTYLAHLGAAFCVFVFCMFDALDGSLATMKDQRSKLGLWLDPQTDGLGLLILFTAMAFYLERYGAYWNYITMYTAWMFLFRGWYLPTLINGMDRFEPFRWQGERSSSETTDEYLKTRKVSLLGEIKHQTLPHTHNVGLYIIIGLVVGQLHWAIAFTGFYLTLWYIAMNLRIIKLARKLDAK